MRKLPAPIRDNAFLLACIAGSVLFNLLVVALFQKSIVRGVLVLVPASPAVMAPPGAVPAPGQKAEKLPPDAKLVPPPEKPPEKKPDAAAQKPPEKKEPPRKVTEKKPEPAKKPAKSNPGNADLAPLAMEAPEPMGVDMAQLIRIRVENRGSEAAGPHHDALFYSADGKLDEKSAPLGVVEAGGALAPGASQWERAQILLPDKTPSGRGYLVVVLNADGAMPESNHANNQLVIPIMVDAASTPLGDPNERPRTTVAWISSKDFRELRARQSRTLQAAVQNETEAEKEAKLHNQPGAKEAKPVPGDPRAQVAAKPPEKTPVPPAAKPAQKPQEKQDKAVADVKKETPKPEAKAPPEAAHKPEEPKKVALETKPDPKPAKPQPVDKTPDGKGLPPRPKKETVVAIADPKPEKPKAQEAPKPEASAKPPTSAKTPPDAKPQEGGEKKQDAASPDKPSPATAAATEGEGATSTPRDTSSAPATQLDESTLEQQPGRVLVGKGVKINTVRIRPPGAGAQIAGVSANPRVAVSFNAQGEATKVEILKSSGNIEWDEAVRQSMYRWTAEGEEVTRGGLVVRWTVLLGAND